MRKQFLALILFAVSFILSCSSSKKTTSSSTGTKASIAENPGNPTLKKLSAKMYDENTYQLEGISDDATYGYDEKNAIKVGGGISGPTSERRYLNGLLGPNGEAITYNRLGSCCDVPSDNGFGGFAVLDIYEIKYDGLDKPIKLYLNMYDPGILKAPQGFTFKK